MRGRPPHVRPGAHAGRRPGRGSRARAPRRPPEGRHAPPRSGGRPRRGRPRRRRRREPPRRAPAAARPTGRAPPCTGRRRPSTPRGPARAPPLPGSRAATRHGRPPPAAGRRAGCAGRPPRAAARRARRGSRGRRRPGPCTAGSRPAPGSFARRRRAAGRSGTRGGGSPSAWPAGTPSPTSASRPRSEWTTMRSKRAKSRRQSPLRRAVRRGRRSCAVKTSGVRGRSRTTSSSGAASHWRWSDVGGTGEKTPHFARMLEHLRRYAEPAPLDPARAWIERLVERVPVGCGPRRRSETAT